MKFKLEYTNSEDLMDFTYGSYYRLTKKFLFWYFPVKLKNKILTPIGTTYTVWNYNTDNMKSVLEFVEKSKIDFIGLNTVPVWYYREKDIGHIEFKEFLFNNLDELKEHFAEELI